MRRVDYFLNNCYIFTYTCPYGSRVGALHRSHPVEDVFDPYWILEVLGKFFMDKVWAIRPEKPAKNVFAFVNS